MTYFFKKQRRFVSTKSDESNLRIGANIDYPILLTYKVKNFPLKIIDEWGNGNLIDLSENNESHEAHLLMLDSSKAIKNLDWHPVYSITESVNETVAWYKEFYECNDKMDEFSKNQILNYSRKAKQMNITWACSK